MRIVIALIVVSWCAAQVEAETTAIRKVVKGLAFTDSGLTLDLYLPDSPTQTPCVITIQGGGFRPQNGQRFVPFAKHLATHGYAAALISYRGSPRHQYRDTMADVRSSVRFVRKVAQQHNIDPKRIGATGRSAGGTLAALLAVSNQQPEEPIQAAVCFAGVFDFVSRFTEEDQLKLQPRSEAKIRSNGAWIGKPFHPKDKDWLAASPITQVDSKDPPILFLHSRNDKTVPWLQSQLMHAAMRKAGVRSQLTIYETGGHAVTPQDANSLDAMIDFFDEVLR